MLVECPVQISPRAANPRKTTPIGKASTGNFALPIFEREHVVDVVDHRIVSWRTAPAAGKVLGLHALRPLRICRVEVRTARPILNAWRKGILSLPKTGPAQDIRFPPPA